VSNGSPDTTAPTVAMTAPASGATVTGTITVSANASDNVGVTGVQFQLDGAALGADDTTAPYSVAWNTTSAAPGTHSLRAIARDAANNTSTSSSVSVTVSNSPGGDVFVALVNGVVQWRNPDGTLRATLTGPSDGQASSVAFDAAGNIYVPHWYSQTGKQGNTVVRFDASGSLMGTFGSTYYCNPSSLTFDAQGNMYVGQADCTAEILKYDSAGNLVRTFQVQLGARGTDHIDLASDGCTMFYASRTRDIFRFDVCNNVQLPVFNTQPLPGDSAFHVKTLPDGGVLVADSQVVVRLDAAGNQIRTYSVTGESNIWGGVDIVGDGTFWASNAFSANIYKFDLETGAILASFNAGTGNGTAAGVGVRR
jgi:sugar lactone lactonase YvrE